MRASLKLICFTFWIFSFTFAQDQECHRKDITVENTEPLEHETYAPEAKVRVNCMSGYTGLIKYQCKGGKWQLATKQDQCSKKKCGHPEDTPNGDFSLLDGNTEYVFGATVQYTCKKGYEMASRVSRRNCRPNGWDYVVPVCEVVKCPPISENEDLTIWGNTEDATYNDYIHFECVSPNKKIDREQNHIHCNEKGEWSLTPPNCIEITCTVSEIPHGTVDLLKEYKKDDTLQYKCDVGYKPRQGTPRCNKYGWSLKPECEENKCEIPHDKHVYIPTYYFKGDLELGAKRSYSCLAGYRKLAERAMCTQDGWKPDPLCSEIMCEAPEIPNAQITGIQRKNYRMSASVQYHCLFRPELSIQITCGPEGKWTGIQACTDGTCQEQELKNVKIIFGYPNVTAPYSSGHVLVFLCTDDNLKMYGQRAIECQSDERWSKPYPQCRGAVQCSTPSKQLQFVTLLNEKDAYNNLDFLRYKCSSPYNETSEGALMCQNGKWNGSFVCTSRTCPPPPYVEHGDYIIKNQSNDVITEVHYTCQSYYVLSQQKESYKCENRRWDTPPNCLKPCEINEAVEMYNLQPPGENLYVKHNSKHRLNCTSGWIAGDVIKQTYVDVQCSDGNLQIDKSCDIERF